MAKAYDLTNQIFGHLTALDAKTEGRIRKWRCQCVCGNEVWVKTSNLVQGYQKSCGCKRYEGKQPKHKIYRHGYAFVMAPDHPRADPHTGRVREHILVMEDKLGRPLTEGEQVHHLNGVRDDNRPENLELWSTVQPSGQRITDKVVYAIEILRMYRPEFLTDKADDFHGV